MIGMKERGIMNKELFLFDWLGIMGYLELDIDKMLWCKM